MPEHVVEHVGLFDVVELLGRADKVPGRKTPVGEMLEENVSGTSDGTATTRQRVSL